MTAGTASGGCVTGLDQNRLYCLGGSWREGLSGRFRQSTDQFRRQTGLTATPPRSSVCPVRGYPSDPLWHPFRDRPREVPRWLIRADQRPGSPPPWIVALDELRVRVANGRRPPTPSLIPNRAALGGFGEKKRRYGRSFSGGLFRLFSRSRGCSHQGQKSQGDSRSCKSLPGKWLPMNWRIDAWDTI